MLITGMPRTCSTALIAAVLLLVATVASSEEGEGVRGPWLQGDARCRCATYEELLAAHGGRVSAKLKASGEDRTTYGIGCLPHDLNSTACKPKSDPKCQNITPTPARCFNDGVPPAWCSSHWCYIAEDDCDLSRTPSDLWPRNYYSYATCGEMDKYKDEEVIKNTLRGRILQGGLRSNTGGWKGSFNPEGNAVPMAREGWYGPMVDFMQLIAQEAGFSINYTDAPDWVMDMAPSTSSFTRCVYATGLGYLDFCIAKFSITTQRSSMTDFFTLEKEPMYLIVPTQTQATVWDKTVRVFTPFTPEVWFTLMLCIIVISLIMVAQESTSKWIRGIRVQARPRPKETFRSIMIAFRCFTDQCVAHDVQSWGAGVSSIGLGFLLLLAIAMYTSNLTTILVADSTKAPVKDMMDAVNRGITVCITKNRAADLKLKWPNAILAMNENDPNLVGQTVPIDVFNAVQEGRICKAGIVYLEDLQEQYGYGEFCSLKVAGLPLLFGYTGFPIWSGGPDDMHTIQAVAQKLVNEGEWDRIMDATIPEDRCRGASEQNEEEQALQSFTLKDMSGAFLLAVLLVFLGLITSLADTWAHRNRRADINEAVASGKQSREELVGEDEPIFGFMGGDKEQESATSDGRIGSSSSGAIGNQCMAGSGKSKLQHGLDGGTPSRKSYDDGSPIHSTQVGLTSPSSRRLSRVGGACDI